MHIQDTTINPAPRFPFSQNVARTMSSTEIANLTGKAHKNVLADIRSMFAELEIDSAEFSAQYKDSTGRALPCFHLDRELTDTLLTGYSAKMRRAVIHRWHELEQQAAPVIPRTLPEALRLAADLADQNNQLRVVLQEQAPKLEALDRIAAARGTLCLTDAAKHLGIPRNKLIEWLRANRWIYRREGSAHWLAYQPRMASGVLEHKVTVIGTDEIGDQRLASQVRVTPKGLATLAQKIAEGAL
ncbi:phage antirepressor YoqD-like protein [Metapseudomonas resinovorans]|uniref:phage antirepressor KilAC domain-containing protein n=1 Tax=Metapseudomonas resinovorans TaxID=53412 RepID=UPI003D1FBFBD